jgi:hypothetical protein
MNNLETAAQTKDYIGKHALGGDSNSVTTRPRRTKVEGAFLLNIIIGECPSILELLPGKDETLLVGWNTISR